MTPYMIAFVFGFFALVCGLAYVTGRHMFGPPFQQKPHEPEYRIVTNGTIYRLERRCASGFGVCWRWLRWTEMGHYPNHPAIWRPHEYTTASLAREAIEMMRIEHARRNSAWRPVGVS